MNTIKQLHLGAPDEIWIRRHVQQRANGSNNNSAQYNITCNT